ncbi:hypothetical protein HA72_2194 [Metallosphaera sedula]|uniref:Uncharacterized protein n=2 Tax=Metallosphaera sedula TaxID=43687 RepID=A4YIT1_METS5|nr:hypothetical protein Msed_2194 [Metallosphaera sedula DSM 5348]AIM28316.1 hypothetical protein HA72_2194 [Metallosphaera sedula]AKV75116.1 hypothetical protein MsedA_2247 [Metallosphaera sedula]AKV77354.1 hypothetical protein MsedB_2249 [Metallosphaera sedula]AKV79605.1 hypothetical protein MsedC_2247 [Metallosphaera sedula]
MIPFEVLIKIMLLIPSIVFLFYSAVYILLFELNVQPSLSKTYRNLSIILIGGGAILLSIYLIV